MASDHKQASEKTAAGSQSGASSQRLKLENRPSVQPPQSTSSDQSVAKLAAFLGTGTISVGMAAAVNHVGGEGTGYLRGFANPVAVRRAIMSAPPAIKAAGVVGTAGMMAVNSMLGGPRQHLQTVERLARPAPDPSASLGPYEMPPGLRHPSMQESPELQAMTMRELRSQAALREIDEREPTAQQIPPASAPGKETGKAS